jgi:hypothetical protein
MQSMQRGVANMRFTIRRAMKSIKLFPLPVITASDALLLDGVGNFVAGKIVKWRSEEPTDLGKENAKRNPGQDEPDADSPRDYCNTLQEGARLKPPEPCRSTMPNIYVPGFQKGIEIVYYWHSLHIKPIFLRSLVCVSLNVVSRCRLGGCVDHKKTTSRTNG